MADRNIRRLDSSSRNRIRQELSRLPTSQRQEYIARLRQAGYEDFDEPIQPQTPQVPARSDIPLWQKGLQTVNAPFEWLDKNINKPVASVLTAPFTPGLPGGRNPNESVLGYAKRQYEQWREPVLGQIGNYKIRPTKGLVEAIPLIAASFATRGAAGALRGVGMAGKLVNIADAVVNPSAGIAKTGLEAVAARQTGTLAGKAAGVGARALTPLAAVEKIPEKIMGGINRKLGKRVLPTTRLGDQKELEEIARDPRVLKIAPELKGLVDEHTAIKKELEDSIARGGNPSRELYNKEYAAWRKAQDVVEKIVYDHPELIRAKLGGQTPRVIKEPGEHGDADWYIGVDRNGGRKRFTNSAEAEEFAGVMSPKSIYRKIEKIVDAATAPIKGRQLAKEAKGVDFIGHSYVYDRNKGKFVTEYNFKDIRTNEPFSAGSVERIKEIQKHLWAGDPGLRESLFREAGTGKPGLSVDKIPTYTLPDGEEIDVEAIRIVYRDTEGKPLLVANLVPEADNEELVINTMAIASNKGAAGAIKSVWAELERLGAKAPPEFTMMPATSSLVRKIDVLEAIKSHGTAKTYLLKREISDVAEILHALGVPVERIKFMRAGEARVILEKNFGKEATAEFFTSKGLRPPSEPLKFEFENGQDIAKKLGVKFQGQDAGGGYTFKDPVTGGNISGLTTKEVEAELNRVRSTMPAVAQTGEDLSQVEIDKIIAAKQGKIPVPPIVPAGGGKPPKAPPPHVTEMYPEGMPPDRADAAKKLIELVNAHRTATASTIAKHRVEAGRRITDYAQELQESSGLSAEEALRKARGKLKGEYPEASTEKFEDLRTKMDASTIDTLFASFKDLEFEDEWTRPRVETALNKVLGGDNIQLNEIALLEQVFGAGLAEGLLKRQNWNDRFIRGVMNFINASRTLLVTGDISGFGRQGAILASRHPIQAGKAIKPMLEAMWKDENALAHNTEILSRTATIQRLGEEGLGNLTMQDAIKSGLAHTKLPSQLSATGLGQVEELAAARIRSKILGFIRGSERAYVTILNDLRSSNFMTTVDGWSKSGMRYIDDKTLATFTPDIIENVMKTRTFTNAQGVVEKVFTGDDLRQLSQYINWASGRGDLPKFLGQHQGALSSVLFAPKLMMSHLQYPTALLPWTGKSALARREAWKQTGAFLSIGAGLLGLAHTTKMGTVELDPRSTDFGKLKVGSTRLDVWSGYAQYMRATTQLITGESKSSSGMVIEKARGETAGRFMQSKLSPFAGLVNDLLQGQTFMGEEFVPTTSKGIVSQVYQRMFPLAAQDMVDGFRGGGIPGLLLASSGTAGVGVTTYTSELQRIRDTEAKKAYNGLSWDEVGQRFGRAAQLELQQTSAPIIASQKEQDQQESNTNLSVMKQYYNEGTTTEQTYRDAIKQAANNFSNPASSLYGNGLAFKDAVDAAENARRVMYGARAKKKEYTSIVNFYNAPKTEQQKAKMSQGDIARAEYYQTMFGADMYDPITKQYDYTTARVKSEEFARKWGQDIVDYIESYSESAWLDMPAELKMLKESKKMLAPYFAITDQIWGMYPPGLKALAEQIDIISRTDERQARLMLRQYPQILRARELIAREKKRMRRSNPQIAQIYNMFYSY